MQKNLEKNLGYQKVQTWMQPTIKAAQQKEDHNIDPRIEKAELKKHDTFTT
tara:strand:- start:563 stop:715 length:153 start_codon:yes stop_codon:yes gene_type:complete